MPFAYMAQVGDSNIDADQAVKDTKRYEDSLFQHQVLGINLLCTKFYSLQDKWGQEEYASVAQVLNNLNGVYSAELTEDDRVLFVIHTEKLNFDALKQHILPVKKDFEVFRSLPYTE